MQWPVLQSFRFGLKPGFEHQAIIVWLSSAPSMRGATAKFKGLFLSQGSRPVDALASANEAQTFAQHQCFIFGVSRTSTPAQIPAEASSLPSSLADPLKNQGHSRPMPNTATTNTAHGVSGAWRFKARKEFVCPQGLG
jgi:hypothetical protein